MYTHVSKCKNDKTTKRKNVVWKNIWEDTIAQKEVPTRWKMTFNMPELELSSKAFIRKSQGKKDCTFCSVISY
jgi:hypothetical protein